MTSYKVPELTSLDNLRRSGPSRHDPGRVLRALIGVQENVLDWVPEERPKLTATGAVVLCAPLMAAMSLWIALNQFLQVSPAAAVVGAVLWAVLICVLDRWLITTSHGVVGRDRHLVLMPRLLVSLLIGVLISEPMTMKIFETAIGEQITTTHIAERNRVAAAYGNCYSKPDPGEECEPYKLEVLPPDPEPRDRAIRERDKRAKPLTSLIKEEKRLFDQRAKECGGDKAPGTSGIAGNGSRCGQRRTALAEFRRINHMDDVRRQLDELNDEVTKQTAAYNKALAECKERVQRLIEKKIAEEEAKHAAVPGLLERFQGLNDLAAKSWTVWWAHLLVAALLILIDCFPVLTKLISRPGAYDRRLAALLESKERLHDNDVRLNQRMRMGDYEMRLLKEESRLGQAREDTDAEARLRTAEREAKRQARMDEVIARAKRDRDQV